VIFLLLGVGSNFLSILRTLFSPNPLLLMFCSPFVDLVLGFLF
jgi:hypothetical protein